MRSLSTEMDELVASWGSEATAALKRSRNRDGFRRAVERTWRTRPDIARFILMHTNSIFLKEDTRLRKGPDKHASRWIFGLYLDEPLARTEVDSWQAALLQNLRLEGFGVAELRVFPAKWGMRTRRLFPELWEEIPDKVETPLLRQSWSAYDESLALDTIKRAAMLAFGDEERAWAFLSKVQGARLREISPEHSWNQPEKDDLRQNQKRFRLTLYVSDYENMRVIVDTFRSSLKAQSRLLGLRLGSIWVYRAPSSLEGCCAFKRIGASVPLRDEQLGSHREEQNRIEEEQPQTIRG